MGAAANRAYREPEFSGSTATESRRETPIPVATPRGGRRTAGRDAVRLVVFSIVVLASFGAGALASFVAGGPHGATGLAGRPGHHATARPPPPARVEYEDAAPRRAPNPMTATSTGDAKFTATGRGIAIPVSREPAKAASAATRPREPAAARVQVTAPSLDSAVPPDEAARTSVTRADFPNRPEPVNTPVPLALSPPRVVAIPDVDPAPLEPAATPLPADAVGASAMPSLDNLMAPSAGTVAVPAPQDAAAAAAAAPAETQQQDAGKDSAPDKDSPGLFRRALNFVAVWN